MACNTKLGFSLLILNEWEIVLKHLFVFLGSIITSKIHTSVNCVVCLLVQVCEHDYIDGPNLNKTLMTEPNFRILEQKFKLISCDENYTKIQYLSHLRPKSYRITSKNSPI